MRNWPRYSRGSFEAEEMTRPRWKKIFFSMAFLVTMSVPVFWPRLSHWSRSPGSMVLRFPVTPIGKSVNYMVGGWQLAVDGWQLAVGSWRLAVGSWQLTVDGWQLAVDRWPLAVESCLGQRPT